MKYLLRTLLLSHFIPLLAHISQPCSRTHQLYHPPKIPKQKTEREKGEKWLQPNIKHAQGKKIKKPLNKTQNKSNPNQTPQKNPNHRKQNSSIFCLPTHKNPCKKLFWQRREPDNRKKKHLSIIRDLQASFFGWSWPSFWAVEEAYNLS